MAYENSAATGLAERPAHVPPELVHPLDQWNGADFLKEPLAYWDEVRPQFRVFWSPYHGGFWCLTRYDDCHEAAQRYDLFSNRLTNIPGRDVRLLPISLDPPEHTTFRRLLNEPFSPARMQKLMGRIRTRCNELIDDMIGGGDCDFMATFANPLPTQIFCELLGLPPEEAKKFIDWNYVILHVQGDESRQRMANEELGAYLTELAARRRAEPREDLMSALIPATIDGRPISEDEVVAFTYLLFMAGLDTVIAALGWFWKFLAENPGHRQRIIDDPGCIPGAVEELLRYHSFLATSRTLTQDTEFAGVHMKEGERIMLSLPSAGRDEAQFPNPQVVDFDRQPNRHIAFTVGPHRCVGSHLARAELRVALEEWHRRIPHYEITPGATVLYHGGAVMGPDSVPLTFVR